MSPIRRMGDRREDARFDVTGRLWASFERQTPAILRNIAVSGAMIEAALTAPMRQLRTARLLLTDDGPELTVAIRYVRPLADRNGDDWCLIGVEFINLSRSDLTALEAFVDSCREGPPA